MKFVIAAPGAKRQIDGSFEICASREDLKHLVQVLQDRLADEAWVYGWIRVPEPGYVGPPNTPATPWSD